MTTQVKTEADEIEAIELATLDAIFKGENEKVSRNFMKVERIFIKGNEFTRSIIANKFILPLTQLLEMNYSWGREYLLLFPKQLRAEYCRQINSSAI